MAGGTASSGSSGTRPRRGPHQSFDGPLKRFYDEHVALAGCPPTREQLQDQAQALHVASGACRCGKQQWRPSKDWMTNWYAGHIVDNSKRRRKVGATIGSSEPC